MSKERNNISIKATRLISRSIDYTVYNLMQVSHSLRQKGANGAAELIFDVAAEIVHREPSEISRKYAEEKMGS